MQTFNLVLFGLVTTDLGYFICDVSDTSILFWPYNCWFSALMLHVNQLMMEYYSPRKRGLPMLLASKIVITVHSILLNDA